MFNFIKIHLLVSVSIFLIACGGGGGGNVNSTPSAPTISNIAILEVNKEGLYTTYPYTFSTSYAQQVQSGYFSTPNYFLEWAGSNLGYTSGYVNPTSGTLKSYSLTRGTEKMWSMTNLNFDNSKISPSADSTILPIMALSDAFESKIYGGVNNDTSQFFLNTSEVDLFGGNDILVLSQNFSNYQFQRVAGVNTSLVITRSGHSTLVKNVETFQFADGNKTFTEIISKLP